MKTTRFLAAIGVACAIALSAMLPQAAVAQTNWSTPGGANASGAVGMCLNAQNQAVPCSDPSALPSPVSGTFSATLAGFTPNNNFATLTATASTSGSTALPAGAVVGFQNTSSVDVSCVLSAGAATATTNKIVVRAGATVFLTVGSNVNAACINQTGSASNVVVMAGGTGLGTNFGGSTGAGGGASNITQVGGVNVPTAGGLQSGALPVDASTSSQIHADLTGPVTACAAAPCLTTIGRVGIDNTVPGTTNGVTDVAAPLGGASSSYLQPTASDNHANIKNGAGTAYSIHTSNNSATKNYLRLYDAGTGFNGCNSATGIIFGMEIPPSDSGFSVILGGSKGLAFSTGLSICVTSGYGATDTTNATAAAIMSNVIYK